MNGFTHILTHVGAMAALAVGSYSLTCTAFSAPPEPSSKNTAADLLAKADHHEMMAADYRARMRVDDKHAIQWFTMANHCDQKAQTLRTAAVQAESVPTYRR